MGKQKFFAFLFVLLSVINAKSSEVDENIIANLRQIFQEYDDFTSDDIFCYCNHKDCDEEVSIATNETYTGICRVVGNCRRTELRGNNYELLSLVLSCIPEEELLPPMRPFQCQTSKSVKNTCCQTDLCIPQERYVAVQEEEFRESEHSHQSTNDLEDDGKQIQVDNELLIYGFLAIGLAILLFIAAFYALIRFCSFKKANRSNNGFSVHYNSPEIELESGVGCNQTQDGEIAFSVASSRLPIASIDFAALDDGMINQRTMIHQIQTGKLIGNGKFGKVYEGFYRGEKVAIKKFSTNHCTSWKRETEVYQAAALKNPCVLQWVGSDEQTVMQVPEYWLITEYIEIGNLFDYLSKNPVNEVIAIQLMRSLTNGISYLHTEIRSGYSYKPRIVHRDIKPTNILVRNNLTCVVADFGLAIYCYYNDISHEAGSHIKGTPRYCAPEKLQNTSSSKKFPSMLEQDVYSLALVLWEICQRIDVIFDDENGKLPVYESCFAKEISDNPSVEEMIAILVTKKQRPEFSAKWLSDNQKFESAVEIIKESWHENGSVRPTALKIRNIFDKIITDNQLNVFSV